jgi:hypothetical protein
MEYFTNFPNLNKLLYTAVFFLLVSTILHAQETNKKTSLGIHAGINSRVLDGGYGPSLSFQVGFRPDKTLQPEIAISFDSQKGETFSYGDSFKASAITLAAGLRLNIRPQMNWNPSLYLMPGLMMGNYTDSDTNRKGSGLAMLLGLSNTFHHKHMINVGYISDNNALYLYGVYIKYGFLF